MIIIHNFLTPVITKHELMDVTTGRAFIHRHLFTSFVMHVNTMIHLFLLLTISKDTDFEIDPMISSGDYLLYNNNSEQIFLPLLRIGCMQSLKYAH